MIDDVSWEDLNNKKKTCKGPSGLSGTPGGLKGLEGWRGN